MTDLTVDALIVDNNMLSFARNITKQDRDDIFDMLMYAEFFATQAIRRQEHWLSWLHYYRSQLTAVGCKLKSPLDKAPMYITDARELDTIGFGLKGPVRAANLVAMAQRSLKAARLNDYARHFFQYGSDSGSLNRFQILPCEESAETGDIHILLCGLHVSATANSNIIGGDWRVSREMVVYVGGGLYAFNRSAYSAHRDRIRSRLTEFGRFNIKNVTVPNK